MAYPESISLEKFWRIAFRVQEDRYQNPNGYLTDAGEVINGEELKRRVDRAFITYDIDWCSWEVVDARTCKELDCLPIPWQVVVRIAYYNLGEDLLCEWNDTPSIDEKVLEEIEYRGMNSEPWDEDQKWRSRTNVYLINTMRRIVQITPKEEKIERGPVAFCRHKKVETAPVKDAARHPSPATNESTSSSSLDEELSPSCPQDSLRPLPPQGNHSPTPSKIDLSSSPSQEHLHSSIWQDSLSNSSSLSPPTATCSSFSKKVCSALENTQLRPPKLLVLSQECTCSDKINTSLQKIKRVRDKTRPKSSSELQNSRIKAYLNYRNSDRAAYQAFEDVVMPPDGDRISKIDYLECTCNKEQTRCRQDCFVAKPGSMNYGEDSGLHEKEMQLCAKLKITYAMYACQKRRFFFAYAVLVALHRAKRLAGDRAGKSQAQQVCNIDANKMSNLYVNWEMWGWVQAEKCSVKYAEFEHEGYAEKCLKELDDWETTQGVEQEATNTKAADKTPRATDFEQMAGNSSMPTDAKAATLSRGLRLQRKGKPIVQI